MFKQVFKLRKIGSRNITRFIKPKTYSQSDINKYFICDVYDYRKWMDDVIVNNEKQQHLYYQLDANELIIYLELEQNFQYRMDELAYLIIKYSKSGKDIDPLLYCFTEKMKNIDTIFDFSRCHIALRTKSLKELYFHIVNNPLKFNIYIYSNSFYYLETKVIQLSDNTTKE